MFVVTLSHVIFRDVTDGKVFSPLCFADLILLDTVSPGRPSRHSQ